MNYETPPTSAPTTAPNSTLAIVSLIAGILGFTFFPVIGSIVAVVTGYMAKKEILESGGALSGDGMATAGLVMGWIGVGLSLIGLCIGAFFIAIPLCLIPLGIISNGSSWILPAILGMFA